MSTIVKAQVLRNLHDAQCVEDALREMEAKYTVRNDTIHLSIGIDIKVTNRGTEMRYAIEEGWKDTKINSFISELTRTYDRLFEEKLARIRMEEARLQEERTLERLSEEARMVQERKLRKERLMAESTQRREEEDLRKTIEEKVRIIKERARLQGFKAKEEVRGKERVLVFVRG